MLQAEVREPEMYQVKLINQSVRAAEAQALVVLQQGSQTVCDDLQTHADQHMARHGSGNATAAVPSHPRPDELLRITCDVAQRDSIGAACRGQGSPRPSKIVGCHDMHRFSAALKASLSFEAGCWLDGLHRCMSC